MEKLQRKQKTLPCFLVDLKKAVTSVIAGTVIGEAYSKGRIKAKKRNIYEVDYAIDILLNSFDDIGEIDKAVQAWADDQGGNITMLEERRTGTSKLYGKRYAVTYKFYLAVTERTYNSISGFVPGLLPVMIPKELYTVSEIMAEYMTYPCNKTLVDIEKRFKTMSIDKKTAAAIIDVLKAIPGAYEEYNKLPTAEKLILKAKLVKTYKNFIDSLDAKANCKKEPEAEKEKTVMEICKDALAKIGITKVLYHCQKNDQ